MLVLALFAADSARKTPLDALPDLSDPQVIIYTEWMGRSPDLVEDQITYPLVARCRARRANGPRLLDVRHELHYALRRGHRHLLGADACSSSWDGSSSSCHRACLRRSGPMRVAWAGSINTC